MVTFKGACEANLDDKGRLPLPKRYRERLPADPQLTLTAGPDGCLLLYETPQWEKVAQDLETMSSFNDKARWWRRLIIGHADDVALDKSDRIQISSALRTHAHLAKQLWLVGQSGHLEIWDFAIYQKQYESNRSTTFANDPPGADGFSL